MARGWSKPTQVQFSPPTNTHFQRAINIYQEDGINRLITSIQSKLLEGDWAPITKRITGKRLHQQLLMYFRLGYWPRIRNPRTFNEKLIHRKLYTNDPRFARVEDKWAVREYVRERVGEEILPEVYHVSDNPETIPFDSLPAEFVVKPTHMSGPIIIVDETDSHCPREIRKKCHDWLNQEYGSIKEEYWYEQIKPQILIEERLRDDASYVPVDYKIYVFHGRAEFIFVFEDRCDESKPTKAIPYDREWNLLDFERGYQSGDGREKPDKLEELLIVAEQLAKGFDFIRVDLYLLGGERIVFGEMTVAAGSGGTPFTPQEYDFYLGHFW